MRLRRLSTQRLPKHDPETSSTEKPLVGKQLGGLSLPILPQGNPSLPLTLLSPLQSPSGWKVLDFDLECRPLSWFGGEWVTKEITAIGAKFLDEPQTYCWLLGEDEPEEFLPAFIELYDRADMVTGHFIRGYDLPTLAGALFEFELPPLEDKLSHDTKLDLIKFQGLSKSQENLGSTLGLAHPKVDMNQAKWRSANRLTPEGLALARQRVVGDVQQHIELRQKLIERGALGPPKVWKSGAGNLMRYSA